MTVDAIFRGLHNRKAINRLAALIEEQFEMVPDEWVNYLLDDQKLDINYYYSITKDHITDSIDWNQLVSYSSYLAER